MVKLLWESSLFWKGYDQKSKKIVIEVDKNYFRPLDVNNLLGNSAKARKKLKWFPKFNLDSLINEMILEEKKLLKNDYKKI